MKTLLLIVILLHAAPAFPAQPAGVTIPTGSSEISGPTAKLGDGAVRVTFTRTAWATSAVLSTRLFLSLDNGKTFAADPFCSATFVGKPGGSNTSVLGCELGSKASGSRVVKVVNFLSGATSVRIDNIVFETKQ